MTEKAENMDSSFEELAMESFRELEKVNEENISTSDLQKLLERTRQRREVLNQKLGKTPDVTPRKRVLQQQNTNLDTPVTQKDKDGSPGKRQCLRDAEIHIKPDTPAISSVRSRMQQLSEQRGEWSSSDGIDVNKSAPIPMEDAPVKDTVVTQPSSSGRRGRFAHLAEAIDTWEDDLSHPTIHKPTEEKKPRWQPPKQDNTTEGPPKPPRSADAAPPTNSPVKAFNPSKAVAPAPPPPPPVPSSVATSTTVAFSPKKAAAPLPSKSPVKSINHQSATLTPAHLKPEPKFQVKQIVDQVPVNAKGLNETVSESTDEEPTKKPISERLATWKKAETPVKEKPVDPAEQPLAAKLASWEQVSKTPNKASVTKVQMPTKQFATPVSERPPLPKSSLSSASSAPGSVKAVDKNDPTSQPVSSRMATWQQRASQSTPQKEEEPTAYPVNARMSAWEEMSSSNQVSYIKKVDPGSSSGGSPKKSPVKFSQSAGTPSRTMPSPVRAIGQNKTVTPSKCVKECITERANLIQSSLTTPSKSDTMSTPGKVGSATKIMQQKLMEQVQHSKTDDIAEKLRKERMAELQTIQKRYQNGVLKEGKPSQAQESNTKVPEPTEKSQPQANRAADKREEIKAKARADEGDIEMLSPDAYFERKLAAMGFDLSDEKAGASFNFQQQQKGASQLPPRPPPPPPSVGHAATNKSAGTPSKSIYRLISQKKNEASRPNVQSTKNNHSEKKVQFDQDDSFDSTEDDELIPPKRTTSTEEEQETEDMTEDSVNDEVTECSNLSSEESDSEFQNEPILRKGSGLQQISYESDGDDVSLSAFVPESVRRQSVIPSGPQGQQESSDDLSLASDDSFDPRLNRQHRHQVASVPSSYRHKSTTNLVALGQQSSSSGDPTQSSSSSLNSTTSSQSSLTEPPHRGRSRGDSEMIDTEDDTSQSEDIDNFLDEALSDDDTYVQENGRRQDRPKAAPRKRMSHMMATADDDDMEDRNLVYSVSMYRSRRNLRAHSPQAKIVRNRKFNEQVEEEEIQMPTHLPPDVERKSIKERIQELQELVGQEQNVIMQTSNALNQCCTGNSSFNGSPEQVECNRLLLLACQKRQVYLTEIQRLKESGCLDPPGSGPKGSLTISDIRLPLKKDFVTKIGSAQDNTVHYFLVLIRNHAQVIVTQMLSTHDPMMRGSLDFPNLIKIHGISGSFKLTLEIYSMSVSREFIGKEKKRKTPKKAVKGHTLTAPSPGGPTAVRTTSFTLITTLPITMRSLDKTCFTLEKIPYLSPLHGTIYMRLKCLMEQNVEERGFLTMFEDVSGLGAWHRRWCVLAGNKVCYWKYPDDETRKEPMGFIDLKRCITEKVGLIPRDICARPNTFELVTVRQPRRGETDTLVSKTYNTMTTLKHMLSADTKEERIVWCNKVNRALANIRTWHSDAMRPIRVAASSRN